MSCYYGKYTHFELTSADLTTPAPLALYDEDGVAVTLLPNERLIIRTLTMTAVAAVASATLFSDADDDNALDAGETLAVCAGTIAIEDARIYGAVGIVPHVVASGAGNVSVAGVAYRVKVGSTGEAPAYIPQKGQA